MIELRFGLPFPPSSNRYWRSIQRGPMAGRVYVSDEAKEYRRTVAFELMRQRVMRKQLSGSLELDLVLHCPDRRRMDVSNRIKVLEDCLQHCGVVLDDRFFDDVRIRRGEIVPGGRIDVVVRQLRAASEQLDLNAGGTNGSVEVLDSAVRGARTS